MCVGLLPSKKPANRCLISKTPDFSKTPVYNHKVMYFTPLASHGVTESMLFMGALTKM